MPSPIDAVFAIHNAFRRDIALIDAAALESARGKSGLEPTIERFRFFNEVLVWHAHGEDEVIPQMLESVAPGLFWAYEKDHRELDATFDSLNDAVSIHDPLETARITKVFKCHLDLHLRKENEQVYELLRNHFSLEEQSRGIAQLAGHVPEARFAEFVAWLYPLMNLKERADMTVFWQSIMPPKNFGMAATLIKQAIGEKDWAELGKNAPSIGKP